MLKSFIIAGASLTLCACFNAPVNTVESQQEVLIWQADIGSGEYRNPILYTDYSDPDVVAVGGD